MRLSVVLLLVLVCLTFFAVHDVNGESHKKKGSEHKGMIHDRNHSPSAGGKGKMMPDKTHHGTHDGEKKKHQNGHKKHSSSGKKHNKNKHMKDKHSNKKHHRKQN